MKISQAFVFLILLFACFLAEAQTSVQFIFSNSQFDNSQYTNSLVRLQGYSYNVNGTMTILGSPTYQYTDTNASTTFSNLDGGYTRGFYQWKVMPFSQQPGLLNPPDVPVNSGWIQVTSTNLGLISSTLCGVTGVPTWGGTGAAYNTQTSDQRYSPSTTSLSNFVQIGQLLSTSNSIVAQIPSTNGFVTAAITNGMASLPALTNYAYPLSNPSNYIPASATNGFVNSTITNGLASLVAVTNQIQSATNSLASTNYVNGQGFVTAGITNGLATTNQLNNYTLTTAFTAGTNSVATNDYANLIATNAVLVAALAAQNSNLLATIAVSSNLLASTKQPASLILSNLALTGAFTNFLAAGTNVLFSTNFSGNTIYINATNQTFLTNGMTSLVYSNPATVLYTNSLPALTNGFVTASITNGLIGAAYVSNILSASNYFSQYIVAGTNVLITSNFSGNTIYINATNQTFLTNGQTSLVFTNPLAVLYTNALPALTNGFVTSGITNGLASISYVTNLTASLTNGITSLAYSNPAVVLYTNSLPGLTNGFVTSSITNGLIGAAYVSNALASGNFFTNFLAAGTNVTITTNFSGNTLYINATNQSFLTNGLVTAAITNGLVGAAITNGLASTGYVASALSPYALTSILATATNTLWTNSVATFYPLSNPSNYVNQTALNGTNTSLLADIAATNTANLIITTNLVTASTNGGNIVFMNNPQFVNALTNSAFFVASTNGNAFGLSISNYAGFWTKTNFLCTTNVIGIVGNGGGTYIFNGANTWTNPFATNYSILLSAGSYYLQSNSVSLYQSANVINWTQIVGANPPPVGSWGSKWGMDGVQVDGWVYSTNLTWQINNIFTNGGLNPTNGVTALQATNISKYWIGVSNLGAVFTNGNTGVGQIVISTTNAPGYAWTNSSILYGAYIANSNGFGTNTTLITPTLSVIVGNSFQFGLSNTNYYQKNNSILGGSFNSIFTTLYGNNTIAGGESNTISQVNANSSFNFIGGGFENMITYTCSYDFIGGGLNNYVTAAFYSAIVAGNGNYISQDNSGVLDASFIGAGWSNSIYGDESFIGGGLYNYIGAAADWSTIGGGEFNTCNGYISTIPGGSYNVAAGINSFAAGFHATATNGAFAWADTSSTNQFISLTNNSFVVRASNGFGINTNYSGTNALKVVGNVDSTVGFSVNGVPVGGGNQVYWITNQTSPLPSAIIPAICYTLMGGQFIKTNSTLDTNGWYQNIADHP